MAGKSKSDIKRPASKTLSFFYIDDVLYKREFIERGKDIVLARSMKDDKVYQFKWSWVKKNADRAYRFKEILPLVNRAYRTVYYALRRGDIPEPQRAGGGLRLFSAKDIQRINDYFMTKNIGNERLDGKITVKKGTLTRTQIESVLNNEIIMYVQNSDGTFVPTWKALDYE